MLKRNLAKKGGAAVKNFMGGGVKTQSGFATETNFQTKNLPFDKVLSSQFIFLEK